MDYHERSKQCIPTSHIRSRLAASQTSSEPPRPGEAKAGTAGGAGRLVVASRDTSDMRARLTSNHFVGRVGELAELELALREAASRKPVVVLLGGESGVGKTRLVLEFERRLGNDVLALRGE